MWSATAKDVLVDDFWPEMPNGVDDRDADVWEALVAVADLAGEQWAKVGRVSAVTLVAAAKKRPPTIGVLLLRHIQKVFDGSDHDKLPTEEILKGLVSVPEAPWSTIRKGEPLDDRGLASRLRKYGITSKPQRLGEAVFKGYSRAQFTDAWKRYVDQLIDDEDEDDDSTAVRDPAVTAVTAVTEPDAQLHLVTGVTDVTDSRETNGTANHGRFTPDPPCFYCDKPVTGKQTDKQGRYAHLSCQRHAEDAKR